MGDGESPNNERSPGQPPNGSAWSLEHVLQQRPWMLTVLRTRTGGCWDVAEDLWSMLVSDLIERPDSLGQVQQLGPWLYRLGCRRAADWHRQQRRSAGGQALESLVDEFAEPPTTRELPPLEALLAGERQADLQQIMGQLPPEDQEVLYLKYQHHWDYRRIAEYLGVSLSQVTHRLRLARGRLKLALLRSPLADDYATTFQWEATGQET